MLSTFGAFIGHGDDGLFHWDYCCLVPGSYPQNQISSPVTLERNSGYLSSLPWRSWHVLPRISDRSMLNRQGMNLAAIRRMFRLSFKMLWTGPNDNLNMLATSRIVIPLFSRRRPSLNSYFHQLCSSVDILNVRHLERRKPPRNVCSSHFYIPKHAFKISKAFIALSPSLKQNLKETCCLFKSGHFQVCESRTGHIGVQQSNLPHYSKEEITLQSSLLSTLSGRNSW
jgi:hypothetical protein